MLRYLLIALVVLKSYNSFSQLLKDDFEGNTTITTWAADDVEMNTGFSNPYPGTQNPSSTVLRYVDNGGVYANIRFTSSAKIILEQNSPFNVDIYVPSSSISGTQPNQISLKLQNKDQAEPWSDQTEIIKPIVLDQWQTVTFNFATDNYVNLDPASPDPLSRTDFNRVVLQVNGENNTDVVTAFIDNFYFNGGEAPSEPQNPNDPVYDKLVWSDEFNTDGALDSSKWFHQTLLPNGSSWFNDEIQHYTDRLENTFVQDGIMHLVAKKETYTSQGTTKTHTSARLNSKYAFTYGRVEVRAKLPTGVGTWPAIWMLGQNINENGAYWDNQGFGTTSWPECGEIDIMEHWGDDQNFVQSAMHTPSSYGGTINHGGQIIPTASSEFHVYTLDWYEDRMVFAVDGTVHYTYQPDLRNSSTWPFTENQYILLNIAIQPTIDPNFTQSAMEIDYVRVYQESSLGTEEVLRESRLTIAPNPVQNFTTVYKPSTSLDQTLEVYTIQGRRINAYDLNQKETKIDMSDWSPGIYFFKQSGTEGLRTYKVLKQ
ncbi:family 16 glycosylhydrolase [Psychroflexus sediminis]|uniref:Por secretion system C-terminal sorting domain-containing protein n=1 Tax=Psychroflexus sediminis TaxID=470826 RepID=A0A1G7VFM7_9FLAO|nr:family 16 glycosylhydrolase [Psychroflexus sediminis]SDG58626.1 Por secretion system C-terminal sorting domain-containing protein [Psychroflexus sediminis]